ncbi:MAG TPA: hypothetical protein VNB49_18485 [Candidatus Dormibacteraeota bacterium]|nr:hypothetical protein [Candidatus Dormibacteraeota bacterium]
MRNLSLVKLRVCLPLIAVLFTAGAIIGARSANAQSTFNHPGNILITDQFNNRVIEIDHAGNIVWQFGGNPNNVGPSAIVGTNDAERVGALTLMSGTGIPAGASPACPEPLRGQPRPAREP